MGTLTYDLFDNIIQSECSISNTNFDLCWLSSFLSDQIIVWENTNEFSCYVHLTSTLIRLIVFFISTKYNKITFIPKLNIQSL